MRIQKLLVLIYIAAVSGAISQQARAEDTEMQRRARELLRQTMATNQPPVDTNAAVAPAAPMAPAAPVTPAVVTPSAPAVAMPPAAVATPAVDTSAPMTGAAPTNTPVISQSVEEQLRASLRKSMEEQAAADQAAKKSKKSSFAKSAPGTTQPAYPVYPPPSITQNPPLTAPVAPEVVPVPAPTTEMGDVATSQTNVLSMTTEQELREKMRQRIAQLEAENKVSSKPATTSDYANMPKGYETPGPAPVYAPGSKEQKLADLLAQYKADQITPAQYHQKRAEIIAGP
jgi:hypothetical protein